MYNARYRRIIQSFSYSYFLFFIKYNQIFKLFVLNFKKRIMNDEHLKVLQLHIYNLEIIFF